MSVPRATATKDDALLPSKATAALDSPDNVGPEPVVIHAPVDVQSISLSVIAVLAAIMMLQYAQSVLVPIVIGILISYALAPIVTQLERVRLHRAVGAGVAVVLLVSVLGIGVYTLTDQAMQIVSSVPEAAHRIRDRVRLHRRAPEGPLEKVQRAATEIDRAAQEASQPSRQTTDAAQAASNRSGVQQVEIVAPSFRAADYLWSGGVGLVGFLGQFVLVLFLVYFFLVTGDLYKRKLVKIAGPTLSQKKITVNILDEINQQIESFMRVQVLTSLLVAYATGLALWWFGIEQYVVWGLLAGIFNSIPYLGPLLVTAALGVVAFVQFDDVLKTVYVCASTFAITSVEGFLLTPALMGRAARMNPVAIFVGLLLWSWLWGLWGTVLAVPMLMMLKAICDHVEDLQPIGELLGE
jgi:predicted PurR-regulated permease PerM